MQIQKLELKNFGKFTNKTFALEDGINVVYGENEFGKSTIHTFIKSMLFGLERSRGRAAKTDVFSIYEPWENGNYYAGTMKFCVDEQHYVMSRTFDKQSKQVSLICEETGQPLSVAKGGLVGLLGKTDGISYENTVSIAQRRIETTEDMIVELKNFAANYHSGGKQDIQVEAVQQYLKIKKRELEHQVQEECRKVDSQKEKLILERDYIQRELQRLESLAKENKKITNAYESKKQKKKDRFKIPFIQYIAIVLLLIMAAVSISQPWNVIVTVVVALAFGLYIWNKLKHNTIGREAKNEAKRELEKIIWEGVRLETEIQEKQVILVNLEEQLQEILNQRMKRSEEEKKIQAIELAMERILQVSLEIQKDFGKEMDDIASRILEQITEGKYKKLFIDEQLKVSIYYEGRSLTLEQVSRGTAEQIYFAIRMAITELLHVQELPVLLDDTFAYYDEKRLLQVLKWLEQNKKQVVIFTCHKREMEIMDNYNIKYHQVI